MGESDLSLLSLMEDEMRLTIVDSLMAKPLSMPEFLDSLAVRYCDPEIDPVELMISQCELMDCKPQNPVLKTLSGEYSWKNVRELSVRLKEALNIIFSSYEQASVSMEAAFSEIDSFQIDTLLQWGLNYLVEERTLNFQHQEGDLSLEELDDIELEREKLSARLFEISSNIDRMKLSKATLEVLKATQTARAKIEGLSVQSNPEIEIPDSIASGDVIYWAETEFGPIIIGGPGNTIYKSDFAVIIDLGGDDIYMQSAGSANPELRFAIAIDLDGNDSYLSKRDFAFGSGGFGIGVLMDTNGEDIYSCGNLSIASAVYGAGILIDGKGNDSYRGNINCQGSALFGFALLIDYLGDDEYSASLYSQGFGYTGGIGTIIDMQGDDNYSANGGYKDRSSYSDHYLTFSQGFACGYRPKWSGGIGLLMDGSGNDNYFNDIFGQGSSYWFGFGGLWDGSGNDNYIAYQYSQGTATNSSVAMFHDLEGQDNYVSRGVSQGSGHDQAAGYFLDSGSDDDIYSIRDLSQGAGNANGIGIFIDEGGDDSYTSRKEYNVQGYGNYNRDFGSIGIMIDLSGADKYNGKGNDSNWWTSGQYGIGIDFPAEVSQ